MLGSLLKSIKFYLAVYTVNSDYGLARPAKMYAYVGCQAHAYYLP